MSSVKDARLLNALTLLRRHMLRCAECKGAVSALSYGTMCTRGIRLTLNAAAYWDAVMERKRDAVKRPDGCVYPCPDITEHGDVWALTVVPVTVTGTQETLF